MSSAVHPVTRLDPIDQQIVARVDIERIPGRVPNACDAGAAP
jgi:hypothetical protein